MERSEIIRMAREAGINFDPAGPSDDGIDTWYGNQYLPSGAIRRLIEIAQAAEREACAKLCEELIAPQGTGSPSVYEVATMDCAEAILNRAMTDDVRA
jgi:hypothetical protein